MSRPCPFPAPSPRAARRSRLGPVGLVRGTVVGVALGLALGIVPAPVSTARAQVLRHPEDMPAPVYPVGALELVYGTPRPGQPDLAALLPLVVELRKTDQGWAAPREGDAVESVSIGGPESGVVALEVSGLARALGALVARLNEAGLYGVDVRPAETDIDLSSESDLRPAGRTALALVVHTGRIAQVRTIAVGDRIKTDWKIDNTLHEKIRLESPLQPVGEGLEGTTDLIDRDRLEDYLHRMNRYGGRMVEAALSPGEAPGDVVLDYRVLESKPWYVYGQTTNTGTDRTSLWQSRFGFTHNQVSNRDDSLSIEYLNAGFEDVNGLSARYEAPFFGARRPEWMDRRKGDPAWLAWFPREKLPWLGVDRLRWGVDFGWNRSISGRDSTVQGLDNDPVRSTQFDAGGHLTYELFQHRDFFVDLIGGLGLSALEIENDISGIRGEATLVKPRIGLHAERITQLATFTADTAVQGQVNEIGEGDLESLGRADTDERYAVLDFNLGYSAFLEPLLRPEAWRDPSNELAATLAHEMSLGFRGQYAFEDRLIPQASQTLGGLYSVRGYDQSVAVGDTVVLGTFEYRFHLPRALPISRRPLRLPLLGDFRVAPQQVYGRPDWDLMLRAFVDAGHAIRSDSSIDSISDVEFDQTLVGSGVGAELVFRSNLRLRADYAFVLKDTNGKLDNPAKVGDSALHVLFSLLY
jgi:hemolysin activation/secretion protein